MKKLVAIFLTVAMVLAMNVSWAVTMTDQDGVIGEFEPADKATEQDKSVVIYKEITAYNPETCEVNAPTITYTYGITAGEAGKTITDASSRHEKVNNQAVNASVTTKAGVGTPTITGTEASKLVITPSNKLNASQYGTSNRFNLTVNFADVDFTAAPATGAGVYRYVITETCAETTKNEAGISEGTVANTLYMDVYVDGAGKIYGYVLFTENDDIDASPDNESAAATAAGKIEGFVGSKDDKEAYSETETSAADKYYTFNFEVKKVVKNDDYAVSTKHQFPFSVTFENANVTAAVLPIVSVKTGTTATCTIPTTAGAITSFSYDGTAATPTNALKLADSAVVSFVGVPCGTTVTINEKNDVTGVTYNSTIEKADTNGDAKVLNTGVLSNNAVINCTTHITAATENHTDAQSKQVLFTNTLVQISPTGVVMRVAPYLLILGAGIVLLVLGFKRRTRKEEA